MEMFHVLLTPVLLLEVLELNVVVVVDLRISFEVRSEEGSLLLEFLLIVVVDPIFLCETLLLLSFFLSLSLELIGQGCCIESHALLDFVDQVGSLAELACLLVKCLDIICVQSLTVGHSCCAHQLLKVI